MVRSCAVRSAKNQHDAPAAEPSIQAPTADCVLGSPIRLRRGRKRAVSPTPPADIKPTIAGELADDLTAKDTFIPSGHPNQDPSTLPVSPELQAGDIKVETPSPSPPKRRLRLYYFKGGIKPDWWGKKIDSSNAHLARMYLKSLVLSTIKPKQRARLRSKAKSKAK